MRSEDSQALAKSTSLPIKEIPITASVVQVSNPGCHFHYKRTARQQEQGFVFVFC